MTVASGAILGWALVAWLPSFFQRSYGMGPEEAGFWMACAMGAGRGYRRVARRGIIEPAACLVTIGGAVAGVLDHAAERAGADAGLRHAQQAALARLRYRLQHLGRVLPGPDLRRQTGPDRSPRSRNARRDVRGFEYAARPGGRAASGRRRQRFVEAPRWGGKPAPVARNRIAALLLTGDSFVPAGETATTDV